jgi:hypothetical protein
MNYAELEPHRARISLELATAARTRDGNRRGTGAAWGAAYESALARGLSETEAEARAMQGYDW